MIIGIVRINPAWDRRDLVLEVLRSVQGPILAQHGCLACDIFDEEGPEHAIVLFERWESQDVIEEHLRSELCRRVLVAVELSGGKPEIRFEHVSASEGIELIERLRDPAQPLRQKEA